MNKEIVETSVGIARQFATQLDREYHNADHFETVTTTALDLADSEHLDEHEKDLVTIAGWYHDLGYIYGPDNHEAVGATLAGDILSMLGAPDEDVHRIQQAIQSTEVPQDPQEDPVSQVIADSDLAFLGYAYHRFYRHRMNAYHEFDPDMTPVEWSQQTGIPLLETQSYMTDTARDRYSTQLGRNLDRLRTEVNDGVPTVLVGGTFDMIHDGHRELLQTAFGYGNPTIGVTSDAVANEARNRTVTPYDERYERVEDVATQLSHQYERTASIQKLDSTRDVAVDADADCIVISPEPKTRERVAAINDERVAKGREELEVIVSDEVVAEDGNRISSTRIKNGEIDEAGNLLS